MADKSCVLEIIKDLEERLRMRDIKISYLQSEKESYKEEVARLQNIILDTQNIK